MCGEPARLIGDTLPPIEVRTWVDRPLRGVNRTSRRLALSSTGLGYLVSRLRSQGEQPPLRLPDASGEGQAGPRAPAGEGSRTARLSSGLVITACYRTGEAGRDPVRLMSASTTSAAGTSRGDRSLVLQAELSPARAVAHSSRAPNRADVVGGPSAVLTVPDRQVRSSSPHS